MLFKKKKGTPINIWPEGNIFRKKNKRFKVLTAVVP
jgi:hypothetical protein